MLKLHYHPSDASLMPHILLEEIGVPFALQLVDRANNAQKSAAYLMRQRPAVQRASATEQLLLRKVRGSNGGGWIYTAWRGSPCFQHEESQ